MCNDYRLLVDLASVVEDFDNLSIKIKMPEGTPNVPAREDIRITDVAPIVRSVEGTRKAAELVNRRLICPLRSGPETMIVWTTKGTSNAKQEAQAGRDYR